MAKKQIKKLTLATILLLFAHNVWAYDFESGGLYYNYNITSDTTVAVTYKDNNFNSYSGNITIPDTVLYNNKIYSVTRIGADAFMDCSGLTSVTIPNSVTSIGDYAFSGCDGLTTIVVDSGNPKYDSRNNCNAIIQTATNTLIVGCKNTIIPNSVTSIGSSAFYNCIGLTSVTIGNSVTSIGDYAFSYCTGLTSVTIGNSVTSIGDYAFEACSVLTSVTIPNSVTSIGDNAFNSCIGLTSVTIPNSVTSIGDRAFYYCTGLTSVTIGNSVTSIGNYAFEGCRGLTSIILPNIVTSIGNYAFFGLPNLIYYGQAYNDGSNWGALCLNGYEEDSLIYTSFAKDTLCGAHKAITNANIPNSVTSIGNRAFYYCSVLTSVTIPNSVTSIGKLAFEGCSGLTSIIIPDSVTRIGNYTFYYCSGLTSVTIGNSVTSIGNYAFEGCTGLTSVTFLGSNTSVESSSTFEQVLTSIPIYIPCGSSSWYSSQPGLSRFSNKIEQFSYKYTVSSQDTTMGNVASTTTPTCIYYTWTISATANYGYHFTQWSDGNTQNPRTIQVLSDTNITAEFDTNAYQLTLSTDTTQGTVIGGGVYKYLNTAIISATANYGYHFTRWSDGDTTNPRNIQVLSDTILIAYFAKETTGIEDVSKVNNAVHLYPNPAKTMLTIENATANIQIFDITGRLLMSIENKETNMLQINVSNLSKGMYFVKVGNYTTKFVKE